MASVRPPQGLRSSNMAAVASIFSYRAVIVSSYLNGGAEGGIRSTLILQTDPVNGQFSLLILFIFFSVTILDF
ncbi:hypothetical protein PVK06_029517 [Gossypium arboreum]|uniref:Uncharacterized protein n=1 Tax=Gossypium arboreum TaxID=29729 RepID=A0ABR0P6V3_GOSAR|nr:hypothetical protein PVK06_029517 [Gossypium arboreum]